jgi:hypothetical protein
MRLIIKQDAGTRADCINPKKVERKHSTVLSPRLYWHIVGPTNVVPFYALLSYYVQHS